MNVPLKVRDYMTTEVVTVALDTEITRVVNLLIEKDISGLVVVDAAGKPVGIITERDCIETATQAGYFDEPGGPAKDYMSTPIESVTPDDNLVNVAVRMAGSVYRRYPVLEDGHLVGIIGRREVLRALGSGSWFRLPDSRP